MWWWSIAFNKRGVGIDEDIFLDPVLNKFLDRTWLVLRMLKYVIVPLYQKSGYICTYFLVKPKPILFLTLLQKCEHYPLFASIDFNYYQAFIWPRGISIIHFVLTPLFKVWLITLFLKKIFKNTCLGLYICLMQKVLINGF